jgi:hypothetical protein
VDLGVPLFGDHVRALTSSFYLKLADVAIPLVWQLHACLHPHPQRAIWLGLTEDQSTLTSRRNSSSDTFRGSQLRYVKMGITSFGTSRSRLSLTTQKFKIVTTI